MHVYHACQNASMYAFTCTCHSAQSYPRAAGPPGCEVSGHAAHTWYRIGSSTSVARSSNACVCVYERAGKWGGCACVDARMCAHACACMHTGTQAGRQVGARAGARARMGPAGGGCSCLPDCLDLCRRSILQEIARRRVIQGQHQVRETAIVLLRRCKHWLGLGRHVTLLPAVLS